MGVSAFLLFFPFGVFSADDSAVIVAKVDGITISAGDIEFAATQQAIAPEERSQAEPKLIERLIDRQLIRAFLASRKIEPRADDLDLQIAKAEAAIKKQGEDPKKLLAKLGYTPERLKRELGLTLAWQAYIRKAVTTEQLIDYYRLHRTEFDGTQLRASQIFLKLPKSASDQEIEDKRQKLTEIRQQIMEKKFSFVDAAQKHSEAPTKDQGGDVGLFTWQGKLPATVSQAAFAMKVNEISEPVVSPFGVHLIQVTERHPGDFSMEDVRPVILDRLSLQMWKETVEKLRSKAKIERNPAN
jgi:peptidyl-prolyl cis-trans isomerase C